MPDPHALLLWLNVLSVSMILGLIWILIFRLPEVRGIWHKIIVGLLTAGLFTRLVAMYVTFVILRSNHLD